jgi:hypothetical protein
VDDWNAFKRASGDNYVDWLAMSTYGKNFATTPGSRHDAMAYAYDDLCSINPEKPVMSQNGDWRVSSIRRQGRLDQALNNEKALSASQSRGLWNERWQNKDGTYSTFASPRHKGARSVSKRSSR